MRNARVWGLTLVLVGLVVGCGSSGKSSDGAAGGSGGASGTADGGTGGAGGAGVSHCDITSGGLHECVEYEADYTGSRPQGCAVLSGTYATGTCDASSSSGGCRRSFAGGGTETDYYYPPEVTVQDVMVTCVNDGNATYVAP